MERHPVHVTLSNCATGNKSSGRERCASANGISVVACKTIRCYLSPFSTHFLPLCPRSLTAFYAYVRNALSDRYWLQVAAEVVRLHAHPILLLRRLSLDVVQDCLRNL